ncbi:hypothetical protein GJ496_009328 [Pomphorhynchus laevis]|nr:hypothetical protein GJ496_009328 [Pomphorhynchus laevis]
MQSAWRIVRNSLEIQKCAIPIIRSKSQILVKPYFTSLNPIDWKIRDGYGEGIWPKLKTRVGRECVGKVVDSGCSKFINQMVACFISPFSDGASSEYILVDKSAVAVLPIEYSTDVSFLRQASCLPYAAATVFKFIEQASGLLVILGAAGGLGHIAIQVSKLNPKVDDILAVCRNEHHGFISQFGVKSSSSLKACCEHLSVLDLIGYNDLVDKVNVKVSLNYATTVHPSLEYFKKYSMLMAPPLITTEYICQLRKLKKICRNSSLKWIFADNCLSGTEKMLKMLKDNELKIHIEREFDFSEFDKALEYLKTRPSGRGKIIIKYAHA